MSNTPEFTHAEIMALKQLAKSHPVKWWKNYPLIVSVLAFLLSLVVATISAYYGHEKNIHDQVSELALATRTVDDLRLKQIEIRDKYRGTPDEGRLGGLINNQIHNTVMMASDIALGLGTYATTPTLLPISQGLYGYSEYRRAEQIAELALKSARSIEDEVAALRWMGRVKNQDGSAASLQEGQKLFLRAITIDQKYDFTRNPRLISWLKAATKVDWAESLSRNKCDDARVHFSEAIQIINSSPRDLDFDRLRARVQQQMTSGISALSSCMPALDTPKLL